MKRLNWKLALSLVVGFLVMSVGVYFIHAHQVEKNAENWFEQGKEIYAQAKTMTQEPLEAQVKKLEEAQKLISRYVKVREKDYDAYVQLGKIRKDLSEKAPRRDHIMSLFATYAKIIQLNEEDTETRLEFLKLALKYREIAYAEQQLDALQKLGKLPPDAFAHQAQIAAIKGDAAKVIDLNAKLLGLDLKSESFTGEPQVKLENYTPYLQLAMTLRSENKNEQLADKVMLELERRHQQDHKALIEAFRYWSYYSANAANAERAKQVLAKGLAIAPDDADLLMAKWGYLMNDRKLDEAETVAQKLRELYPKDVRGYIRHAETFSYLKKAAETHKAIQDGLKVDPNDAILLSMQFNMYLQPPINIAAARETLDLFRKLEQVPVERLQLYEGVLLAMEGKWSESFQALTTVKSKLSDKQDLNRADLWIARCYRNLGEFDQAKKFYEQAKNGDPTNPETRLELAELNMKLGKIREAQADFETVAASLPGERLYQIPQLWRPLLDIRINEQLQLPQEQRNWAKVDAMVADLSALPESVLAKSDQAGIQAAVAARKGDVASALAQIIQQRDAQPDNISLWQTWADIQSRESKPQELLAELQTAPAAVRDSFAISQIQAAALARIGGAEGKAGLLKMLDKAGQMKPNEALNLQLLIASIFNQLGMRDEALLVAQAAKGKSLTDHRPYKLLLYLLRDSSDPEAMAELTAEILKVAGPENTLTLEAQSQLLLLEVRLSYIPRVDPKQGKVPELTKVEQEKLAKAKELADKMLKIRPEWPEPHKLLADVANFQNDLPGTIEQLQFALKKGGLEPNRLKHLSILLAHTGRSKEANEILERFGGRLDAKLEKLQVDTFLREGRVAEAAALLDKMKPAEDASIAEQYWYAQSLRGVGKTPESIEMLRTVVNRDATISEAWQLLAQSLLQQNKLAEAEVLLDEIESKAPADKRDLMIAQCAERLGLTERAQKHYLQAISSNPESIVVRQQVAVYYMRSKLTGTAQKEIETIKDLAKKDPKQPENKKIMEWANRATVSIESKDGNQSYEKFLEAVKILDNNTEGEIDLQDLMLQIALYSNRQEPASMRRAIQLFEILAARRSLTTADQVVLAQLQHRTGNLLRAKDIMNELLSKPAVEPRLNFVYAEMLAANESYNDADLYLNKYIELIRDASRTDPQTAKIIAEAVDLRATILIKTKKIKEGTDLVIKSLGVRPLSQKEAPRLLAAALLLESLEQFKPAEQLYREYAEMGGEGRVYLARFIGRYIDLDQGMKLFDQLAADPKLIPTVISYATGVIRYRKVEYSEEKLQPYYQMLAGWYQNLRAKNPETPQIKALRAEIYEVQGKLKESADLFKQIISDEKVDLDTAAKMKNNLAYLLAIQNQPGILPEAYKNIEESIRFLGPQSDLLDTRGTIALFDGKYEAALKDFQDAVLIPAGLKYYHLAVAHFKLNNLPAAQEALNKAKRSNFNPRDLHVREREMYNELAKQLNLPPAEQLSLLKR